MLPQQYIMNHLIIGTRYLVHRLVLLSITEFLPAASMVL